jgi:hypothetical protein
VTKGGVLSCWRPAAAIPANAFVGLFVRKTVAPLLIYSVILSVLSRDQMSTPLIALDDIS